ncbi:hypothetical protein GCM10028805_07510 [Spirosoma harenae]
MTFELYTAPAADSSDTVESPISNITGELPEQEPDINQDNLLGSFDTREEAMEFVQSGTIEPNQSIIDSHIKPFNDYTHVELLTVTVQNGDQSSFSRRYYLVNDEGY